MALFFMLMGMSAVPLARGEVLNPAEEEVFDDFEEFGEQDEADPKPVFDPLKGYNRAAFHFNDKLYYWVLKPLGKGYGKVVPEPIRLSAKRFFHNLKFPLRFANNVLQFKWAGAGRETARFVTNSTVGFLGFFDPARAWWGLRPSEEDFGQTLGHYGIGSGFPITIPFLGPSNLRDAVALVPDFYLDPVSYVGREKSVFFPTSFSYGGREEKVFFPASYIAVRAFQYTNDASLQLEVYENIKKNALDPYTFIRDAYKQHRDQRIKE